MYPTTNHSPDVEAGMTGDPYVPMTNDEAAPGAVALPDFGDLLSLEPGQITEGDLYALQQMGDPMETGTVVVPSFDGFAKKSVKLVSPGGVRPVKPGFSRTLGSVARNSTAASGLINARTQLLRAGVANKGSQDALISSALTAVQMNSLGRRAAGMFGPADLVPFVSVGSGTLIQVDGLREGSGAKASSLKWQLTLQENTLPFKSYITSLVPAAGPTVVNLKASFPLDTNVPIVGIMIVISAAKLVANSTKVFTVALQSGAGGVINKTFYSARIQYDELGTATLFFLPSAQIDGNFYLTALTGRRDTVLANDLDVAITISGNDGTNDALSVIVLGSDNEYTRALMARL